MRIRPAQALTHPMWLTALGLLVLNDHVLKGSGWLPSVVTGKLSDVAGLVVAPTLLAALLWVRTPRALAACHLAVGLVFAALQVVPGAAQVWDAALTSVGVPWHTVADPTDALALVALACSWHGLRPAMAVRPWRPVERRLAVLGGGMGLLGCLATSPPEPGPGGYADVLAQVLLHNDSPNVRVIGIRQVRSDVLLDCETLLTADPGELLTEELFEPAVMWELPGYTTVAALVDPSQVLPCHAVWVSGDTFLDHVLVWEGREPSWRPGEVFETGIRPSRLPLSSFEGEEAFQVRSPNPECAPQPALDRVDWSLPVPGTYALTSLAAGVDGCYELGLQPEGSDETRGYLCIPEAEFPFEVGDSLELTIRDNPAVVTLERPADDAGLAVAQIRGGFEPEEAAYVVFGVELRPAANPEACLTVAEECGRVVREAALRVDSTTVMAGGTASQSRTTTRVTRAEERVLDEATCGQERVLLGFDIDVVLRQEPVPSEMETNP